MLFLLILIDTDGFVIPSLEIEDPSLEIEDPDRNKTDIPKVEDTKLIEVQVVENPCSIKPFSFLYYGSRDNHKHPVCVLEMNLVYLSLALAGCKGRAHIPRTSWSPSISSKTARTEVFQPQAEVQTETQGSR